MDAYVDEILIRERMADTERRAAKAHLLGMTTPRPAPRGLLARVSHVIRHLRHHGQREALPLSRASQHS